MRILYLKRVGRRRRTSEETKKNHYLKYLLNIVMKSQENYYLRKRHIVDLVIVFHGKKPSKNKIEKKNETTREKGKSETKLNQAVGPPHKDKVQKNMSVVKKEPNGDTLLIFIFFFLMSSFFFSFLVNILVMMSCLRSRRSVCWSYFVMRRKSLNKGKVVTM